MEGTSQPNVFYGLRKRSVGQDRSASNNLLNLDGDSEVSDGVIRELPSPRTVKLIADEDEARASAIAEFRKKQQSFEIHIEDCDEEEMSAGSSDEEGSRPVTPAPPQFPDFGGSVVHKESLPDPDYLQIGQRDQECLTDVSEGESDNDEEMEEDQTLPENSVIKRAPPCTE